MAGMVVKVAVNLTSFFASLESRAVRLCGLPLWPRLRALALAAEGEPAGGGGALNSTESAVRVTLIHLPRPSHPRVAVPSSSSLRACLLHPSCPLPSHHPAACHRFPSMLWH